ncbi:hypothetical protein JYU06_05190, partial [Desulfotalea psychrophila]|nr:hypothetical protein [Desulfotalea psychrophila]
MTPSPLPPETQTEPSNDPFENAEKMHLHPITLAFRKKQSHLESAFLDDYFRGSLTVVRIVCLAASLIYGLFGILDVYLVPEEKVAFWLFRYAIFCPL